MLYMALTYNAEMTVSEIRRANINYLAERWGRKELAERLGYSDTVYINQLCGGHGSFGNRVSRKIEERLGLQRGWMDIPYTQWNLYELPDDLKPEDTDGTVSDQGIREMDAVYRKLSPKDAAFILTIARHLVDNP